MRRLHLALLPLVFALACGGALPPDQGVQGDEQNLAPPIELVSPGVYRGRRPDAATLRNLKALGVRTVLNLEDDRAAVASERGVVDSLGMSFVSQPMSGFWTPHDAQVDVTNAIVADESLRPIFIHCLHGEDRTGLIVGFFRVFEQGWTPDGAYQEMLAKGFHRSLFLLNHYYETKTGWDD